MGQRCVLVVEDSRAQRARICAELIDSYGRGLRILEAGDGEAGLALVKSEHPDLALCDIHMPLLDGFGFVKAVRETPGIAHTPILMVTGAAEREAMRRAMGLGADDVLIKPYTAEELRVAVHSQFEKLERQTHRARASLDRMRESILTSVPHELRTPLTALVAGAGLLLANDHRITAEKRREILKSIDRGANRLASTFSRYIELIECRASPGPDQRRALGLPRLEGFEITGEWLRGVVEAPGLLLGLTPLANPDTLGKYSHAYDGERERVRWDVEAAQVACDPVDLGRALHETIGNALRFSQQHEAVVVCGKVVGDVYALRIESRGEALPPEFRLMQGDFMQFNRTHQEQQGSGLGLSIAAARLARSGARMAWSQLDGTPNRLEISIPRHAS